MLAIRTGLVAGVPSRQSAASSGSWPGLTGNDSSRSEPNDVMNSYIILTTLPAQPSNSGKPAAFRDLAKEVSSRVSEECPGIDWKHSFAIMGRIDVVDVVECDDPAQVAKAAMIIREASGGTTETLAATAWDRFLDNL